jgi:hypothetical protein
MRRLLWTERPRVYKDSASPAAMRFRQKWQAAES